MKKTYKYGSRSNRHLKKNKQTLKKHNRKCKHISLAKKCKTCVKNRSRQRAGG